MPDLLIRNVPEEVVDTLKRKAANKRHSLQQELLLIIEKSAKDEHVKNADYANTVRERLQAYGNEFSDSTGSIRSDRER
ncbi:MAG: FitA-like ribbon-helix-helix domain-containing protein [Bacillota bacterium]